MSALLNLVEAATALTQLVSPRVNWPPPPSASLAPASAQASIPPATSTATAHSAPAGALVAGISYPPRPQAHTICDEDDNATTNATLARMATLREHHLQALRAAAAHAGLTAAPPSALPPPPVATPYQAPYQAPHQAPHQAPYQEPVATPAYAGGPVYPALAHPQETHFPPAPVAVGDAAKEMFPLRLHALLADPSVRDVAAWLPHGTSFVVLRPDDFATRVLPRYFAPEGSNSLTAKHGHPPAKNKSPGVHKYPSFTRKLNRWGFRQIARGPDAGAFCHEQFQRDRPELCRGMVCQKSRRLNKVAMSAAGAMDDTYSVSSASTMGTKQYAVAGETCPYPPVSSASIMGTKPYATSGDKRPWSSPGPPYSSTVTVSTAGVTSNKSLPFKKRKSGQMSSFAMHESFTMNDIPSMISHRSQKMPASTSSVTESDLTSDASSVNSGPVVRKAPVATEQTAAHAPVPAPSAEAAAMEALARHFHQQQRAFALAALMANSRMAIQAAGFTAQASAPVAAPMLAPTASPVAAGYPQGSSASVVDPNYSSVVGALTTSSPGVIAPTVSISPVKQASAAPAPALAAAIPTAVAAKTALYKAYLQALASNAQSP